MKQKETQQETMSKEKRVVFFEGKSWYHRTKELQDDLTTKYGKKGGFETLRLLLQLVFSRFF